MLIFEVEEFLEFLERHGNRSNLQKTKDIINANVNGARHRALPFLGADEKSAHSSYLSIISETIFAEQGSHRQANTRPISRPPSG
jgi:hypothetical protein